MADWVLVISDVAVGLILAASGVLVLGAHKERRVGFLLLLSSAAWFAGALWAPLLFLHRGPMVHLHLSYPTGVLRRWAAIVATGAAYIWAVAEGWISQPAATAALAALMAAAAVDGYRRTSGPARKAGLPGFVAALLFAGILSLSAANLLLDLRADFPVALVYNGVMAFVAIWLTIDLLRGQWTEATLADLVTQLGSDFEGAGVEADLRRAVGDPGLTVGYWDASTGGFRHPNGESVEPGENTVTINDDHGNPLAILRHDAALRSNPALLDGAAAALRLVASNVKLRGEIGSRVDELAAARRRIVEATDEQRRLLQVEIAVGPEAELVFAASALAHADRRLGPEVAPLITAIGEAHAVLERFAGGLGPALEGGGLHPAINRLAARSGLRTDVRVEVDQLAHAVETTVWFVCAEALTNAAKHAHATHVRLTVTWNEGIVRVDVLDDGIGGADLSGSGLRGLVDRVSAVGGTLTVTDALASGTLVSASIPAGRST